MADFFNISTSALQAFQNAIAVTSNNIANANTPGYTEESVNLATAIPQPGSLSIGSGVDVTSVSRAVSELANSQLNSSQSSLGQLNGLQTYTNQIDNIIGTTAGGLTTALQNYYNAWSTVANNPTSTAGRQALIGAAQSVATSLNSTSSQLQSLNSSINSGITADVNQINSLASSIGKLNAQIVVAKSENGGQAPNQLLDQRDQALSSLSQLVGVTTSTDSNGALNVFVANGQPLVLQGSSNQLTTEPNQYNASQLEISTSTDSGNIISSQITSGDLGGLLAARSQAVDPALNAVGQIATGLASAANTQQNSGLDLNGNEGANLFTVGGPQAVASSNNTGSGVAAVSVSNVGALTTDNYVLSYAGGAYSLTDQTTGAGGDPHGHRYQCESPDRERIIHRPVGDAGHRRFLPDPADSPGSGHFEGRVDGPVQDCGGGRLVRDRGNGQLRQRQARQRHEPRMHRRCRLTRPSTLRAPRPIRSTARVPSRPWARAVS